MQSVSFYLFQYTLAHCVEFNKDFCHMSTSYYTAWGACKRILQCSYCVLSGKETYKTSDKKEMNCNTCNRDERSEYIVWSRD